MRAKTWSLSGAFGYFGAVAANPRWSWSARSADGKTVVVNWWKDEITRDGIKLVYDMRDHDHLSEWRGRNGNRDRIRNLVWARDHCDGLFRIVWCEASDVNARVRKTVGRYPDKDLWMRLVDLN
jgi:hypothetical protein